MKQINKSYCYAIDCFNQACQEQIDTMSLSLHDKGLVIDTKANFEIYIKTFKTLDHSIKWHQQFIKAMIKSKIDMLLKCIDKTYGTH